MYAAKLFVGLGIHERYVKIPEAFKKSNAPILRSLTVGLVLFYAITNIITKKPRCC